MPDLIYRFDHHGDHARPMPCTCKEAVQRLEEGNRHFATILTAPGSTGQPHVIHYDANALGLPNADGSPPKQTPFAAVLSCADARVPVEMVLGQACNDIFVVRVAGNVLGSECLGSLDYALTNMADSLRVVVPAIVGLGQTALRVDGSAEFAAPDHERRIEQAAALEVLN